MDVAAGGRVHVHVDQAAIPQPEVKAGLLDRLPQGRVGRRLARLQVAARLQPEPQQLVAVEEQAARAGHDGRGGDVGEVGFAVEGPLQDRERGQEGGARFPLAPVEGLQALELALEAGAGGSDGPQGLVSSWSR